MCTVHLPLWGSPISCSPVVWDTKTTFTSAAKKIPRKVLHRHTDSVNGMVWWNNSLVSDPVLAGCCFLVFFLFLAILGREWRHSKDGFLLPCLLFYLLSIPGICCRYACFSGFECVSFFKNLVDMSACMFTSCIPLPACVFVCVFVCMYVCACVRVCLCIHIHMSVSVCLSFLTGRFQPPTTVLFGFGAWRGNSPTRPCTTRKEMPSLKRDSLGG